MRELTNEEIRHASGGYSATEGLAALGVVATAGAAATVAPFAAGAVIGGVIGVTAIDITKNLS
ncbi:MAG: hypothetical protein ACQETO_12480 [Pseudomonadota bacterium]